MDVARVLSFDVPSSNTFSQEMSLIPAGDVDEEIETRVMNNLI